MMKVVYLPAFLLLNLFLWLPDPGLAGEKDDALHGREWAFGHSLERNDAIWKNGVSASSIRKKAAPDVREPVTDTSGGINRAIENVPKPKGSLGVTVSKESSAWKAGPRDKKEKADEMMFRDKRHVVRAFADVKASDDLSISVGPELILKDENNAAEGASENQPDSALGVGMQFKFDF